ncbi:hypothetical protein [Burkholderia cepacia]|uniref:hypothetical protein n=1 Tax=Burkholderia cepacia TaxID=292 RepID=UPI001F1E1F0A|nr:hypothetical protein [Burkholderia cepacia]UIY58094.1 hypothetical protein LZ568_07725 [Burkholderia cepacia]
MANLQANVPLIDVPPIDLKTGKWNEAWFLFLIQLFRRTGGTGGGDGQLTIGDVLALEETFAAAAPVDSSLTEMQLAPVSMQNSITEQTFAAATSSDSMSEMVSAPVSNTDYSQGALSVALGASPATYKATYRQGFYITGGTVSALSVQRGSTTLTLNTGTNLLELSIGDQVNVTYSSAPSVTVLAR